MADYFNFYYYFPKKGEKNGAEANVGHNLGHNKRQKMFKAKNLKLFK